MSINLTLLNWPNSIPPSPSPPYHNVAAFNEDDEMWKRSLKLSKTAEEEEEEQQQQMLSFSGQEKVTSLPYFYNSSPSNYIKNFTGYNYGCGGASANMHEIEMLNGILKGPFTPSQWMELEQQALIYKHITSNMPVPSTLLTPIRRALSHAAAFSHYYAPHFTSMNWGGFHLGLANNNSNDPEPGRCRRTDGKKWRCSRDAVGDQKYCERHINRGRHRSRKPVERLVSRYSIANASSAHLKTTELSHSAVAANGLISEQKKISLAKNLHLGTSQSFESAHNSRGFMSNEEMASERVQAGSQYLSVPHSSIVMQPRESLYQIHNKPKSSYEQLFKSDFGLVSSDALQNHSGESIAYRDQIDTNKQKQTLQHSTLTHQFIDDCPKSQPDHTMAWEFHSNPMGLGGPLGEALQNSSNTKITEGKNMSSGLNLMIHECDRGSRFISSPTGVLQKEAAFASRTNSSMASSPRAEINTVGTF